MSRGVRNALYGIGTAGSSFLDAFLRARQQAQENDRWERSFKLRQQQVENAGLLQQDKLGEAENKASRLEAAQLGIGGFDKYGRAVVPPGRPNPMSPEAISSEQRAPMSAKRMAFEDPQAEKWRLRTHLGIPEPEADFSRMPQEALQRDISTPMGQAAASTREAAFESRRKPVQKGIEALPVEGMGEIKSAAESRLAGLPVEAQQLAMQHGTAEGGTLRKMMDRAREVARTETIRKAASTTAVREQEKLKALRTKNLAMDLGAQEKAGQLIRPLAPGAPEPILPRQPNVGAKTSPEETSRRAQLEIHKANVKRVQSKASKERGALTPEDIRGGMHSMEQVMGKSVTPDEAFEMLGANPASIERFKKFVREHSVSH